METFDAVANWVTPSVKLPAAAPGPNVTVASLSFDSVELKPLKLTVLVMVSSAPRNASTAVIPGGPTAVVNSGVSATVFTVSQSGKNYSVSVPPGGTLQQDPTNDFTRP